MKHHTIDHALIFTHLSLTHFTLITCTYNYGTCTRPVEIKKILSKGEGGGAGSLSKNVG